MKEITLNLPDALRTWIIYHISKHGQLKHGWDEPISTGRVSSFWFILLREDVKSKEEEKYII